MVAGASLALEVTQYVLGVGSSDATDVVVNTVGGLAGLGLVALARGGLRARTAGVMTWVCAVGTALALLATVLYLSSPVQLRARPRRRSAGARRRPGRPLTAARPRRATSTGGQPCFWALRS